LADGVHVTGVGELKQLLQLLPKNVAKNVLRGAVNAGATVIRKEIVARAPRDTGTLKRAVFQKQIRELSSETNQVFYVGVRKGKKYQAVKRGKKTVDQDAFYASWVEYGHMAANGVQVPAHPFVRPAYEATKDQAMQTIRDYLAEHLARFEIPRFIRISAEPLPRTASGKILKRQLRDEAAAAAG